MTLKRKIVFCISTLIFVMLIIPLLVVNFSPDDLGMALCFVLFFAINPITVVALSFIAGTDIRKLWWIPLAMSVAFPLFFAFAVSDIVLELFTYSAIYLCIGIFSMLFSWFAIKIKKR